jgi:hypothetical protein
MHDDMRTRGPFYENTIVSYRELNTNPSLLNLMSCSHHYLVEVLGLWV